jgi:hypothetical protein
LRRKSNGKKYKENSSFLEEEQKKCFLCTDRKRLLCFAVQELKYNYNNDICMASVHYEVERGRGSSSTKWKFWSYIQDADKVFSYKVITELRESSTGTEIGGNIFIISEETGQVLEQTPYQRVLPTPADHPYTRKDAQAEHVKRAHQLLNKVKKDRTAVYRDVRDSFASA